MTTEFQGFPKIARLFRDVVITEKIDGTNACVVVPEDGLEPVLAQSRTRFVTPVNDNYGFAAWVRDHERELRDLGPGRHFGEWYGQGINRNYGLKERRFALFNTCRWDQEVWQHFEDEKQTRGNYQPQTWMAPPACCEVVPALNWGPFGICMINQALDDLRSTGSFAVEGFDTPEGIVVYHTASNTPFKVTLGGDGEKGLAVHANLDPLLAGWAGRVIVVDNTDTTHQYLLEDCAKPE